MAFVEWEMHGTELGNCNCNWGCPCQFNSLPDKGHCRAHAFIQIDRGHFGAMKLDGLRWGILAAWPGAVHQGNGTFMTVIDERADDAQRAAIEAISHGKETEPGSLIWQVFSTTVTRFLPTQFKPIDLAIDVDARSARVRVPGLLEASVEPIRNPVTGDAQQARLTLPNGFEFTEAEFASGRARSDAPIELAFDGSHAHLARIHWSTRGVLR
ncbi:DUF1326 domain-containing protein [Dokdonella soli]|uniref:DUF1326 domain-containing protein n=1 Tax=Dokdonella soli TaxID=529810 RepID=A0ABP3TKU6_9GAMM